MKLGGMGWNCVNMGEMVVKAPLRGAGGEAGEAGRCGKGGQVWKWVALG